MEHIVVKRKVVQVVILDLWLLRCRRLAQFTQCLPFNPVSPWEGISALALWWRRRGRRSASSVRRPWHQSCQSSAKSWTMHHRPSRLCQEATPGRLQHSPNQVGRSRVWMDGSVLLRRQTTSLWRPWDKSCQVDTPTSSATCQDQC